MKPLVTFLLLTALTAYNRPLSAQTKDTFSTEDYRFFQQKADEYQRWLTQTNLGKTLSVELVRMKKHDTELELVLNVRTHNPDSAIGMWNQLRRDFSAACGGQPLETELFRVFAHKMEINPLQGNVQVYVPDPDGSHNLCFYVGIWEENNAIQLDARLNPCKSDPVDVAVKPIVLRQMVKGKSVDLLKTLTSSEIFDKIIAFSYRWEQPTCPERYPKVSDIERSPTRLKFTVSDLCQVVLTDEKRSLWCDLVTACGGTCNDTRRERLEFDIEYIADQNKLRCNVLGKFGSGVYKPRKNGWLNMEPDFADYLDDYIKKFRTELENELTKP